MVDGRGSDRGAKATAPMINALKRHKSETVALAARMCRVRGEL